MSSMNWTALEAGGNRRVGYVVKRYPRFSETFIVNEILAHEAAGRSLEIFSLYPPNDTHFQDVISRVRSPVTYLIADGLRAGDLWEGLEAAGRAVPGLWATLGSGLAAGANAREIYQAAWLARLVRQRGVGHLHAHFATTATSVARLAAAFAGIPFTFTTHAKDIFHEEVDSDDVRRKLESAATVVTVSDYNVVHLRREHGEAASRVRRIYNGIHLDRFAYSDPFHRSRHVVGVGRLIEKKGFSVLIEAARRLRDAGVEFTCEIIGSGEAEESLRGQIAGAALEQRVRLSGALPQGEVIRRVSSASVFAAPCVVGRDGNADGMPTVLLEAMALGTPCVATDVTGIPEIIRHGETGWLVGQHDAQALAEAIRALLDDAGQRRQLAEKARGLLESEFDIRRNAELLRAVFDEARCAA
ncbi:MAG: glycosyltransferase [Verrucomicrobiales bacterium]|nr:glycosyltransferase [Verrucomicrobiales bacterium]